MIGVAGAGAFGTALAVALARAGRPVRLWARETGALAARRESPRLPGVRLPETVTICAHRDDLAGAQVLLLALPMQALGPFLAEAGGRLGEQTLVACCKGVDLATLSGPAALIAAACPGARAGVLTGPSFAADIAQGLPTALTLAMAAGGEEVQPLLSTPVLRVYRTTDVIGAELGGALKNVVAIAAGVAIGAGLGESARAALMTRGHAEMMRLALTLGARAETLMGLSGLGDLILTCTSAQSRNFRFGLALGAGRAPEPGLTVEGVATARAAARLGAERGVELPVVSMVAALVEGRVPLDLAVQSLMSRPLKAE
jgi:glycerol-3-phosphate dehydrogenase (NAD(P)+)